MAGTDLTHVVLGGGQRQTQPLSLQGEGRAAAGVRSYNLREMPNAIPPAAVRDLQRALSRDRVLSAPEGLLVFEYDGTIERGQPQVVVFPDTTAEVAAAVVIANRYDLPIVPRGAGTGLSGGARPPPPPPRPPPHPPPRPGARPRRRRGCRAGRRRPRSARLRPHRRRRRLR